jgi:hypothetical protein
MENKLEELKDESLAMDIYKYNGTPDYKVLCTSDYVLDGESLFEMIVKCGKNYYTLKFTNDDKGNPAYIGVVITDKGLLDILREWKSEKQPNTPEIN